MVVLAFLLCHSLRQVLNYTMEMAIFSLRFVAKVYQVLILDDYLEERR